MANYVLSAADGLNNPTLTITAYQADGTNLVSGDTGLEIAYLQDVTVNNAQDVFTWTQLDNAAKLQVPTTATNSIDTTIVVDLDSFFGTTENPNPYTAAAAQGLINLSKNKQLIKFEINIGDATTEGAGGRTISGNGYVTGLSPTVSADSPVWTTPLSITVTGDYTVSAAA